jgi:DNA-binding CsgD family transcriptional regulator
VCRWACADALLQAGDSAAALESLRAAESGAERIGFEPLAARTRRSLRRAGERPGRAAATGRSAGRMGGLLTSREHEVLGLVERGLTNAEIARRISLGRPTVARLLSNAMLKLGAESRAQAVVLAARVVAGAAESGAFAR